MSLRSLYALSKCNNVKLLCYLHKKPQYLNLCLATTTRNISFFKRKTEDDFKTLDKIDKNYELIYKCTFGRYLLVTQSLTTVSAVILSAAALLNFDGSKKWSMPLSLGVDSLFEPITELYVFALGFIVITFASRKIIEKLPLRIYYNKEKTSYTAVFCGIMPPLINKVEFLVGDVSKIPMKGFLPWNESKYKIKNSQDMILSEISFRRPIDMNIMLGYQKESEDHV